MAIRGSFCSYAISSEIACVGPYKKNTIIYFVAEMIVITHGSLT